ncbi:hypothetical protein Plhal304r1_c029g0096701 [Plasmopara halstedii]
MLAFPYISNTSLYSLGVLGSLDVDESDFSRSSFFRGASSNFVSRFASISALATYSGTTTPVLAQSWMNLSLTSTCFAFAELVSLCACTITA